MEIYTTYIILHVLQMLLNKYGNTNHDGITITSKVNEMRVTNL
jgi:hypothetical protein